MYVGEVESDRVIYGAITGMLQTLDPHSSFMDPKSFAQSRERQEGRYYGIGVLIRSINGDRFTPADSCCPSAACCSIQSSAT